MPEYRSKEQKRTFYKSSAWEKLRLMALERDHYECQQCKREGKVHVDSIKVEGQKKSVELNVHHIREIENHPELALEIENLETLCLGCHNKQHPEKGFGKDKQPIIWDDERW
ncbi:HNH endonuclease [Fictibacillus fluitans]|uniref:Putative HNH nuclease YajD n=1 Tax=Fictibacillus fluitans TaxID=3058422 RepID=A0ABT8HX26_9BACL|nr:HNH endonuclease [Fictibacillus sp. NE201]MDN4525331.1 HNH endonuclease [Fictibacillus sp. NE201]